MLPKRPECENKIGRLVDCLCSKLQKDVLFLGFAKTVMSSVEDLHSALDEFCKCETKAKKMGEFSALPILY